MSLTRRSVFGLGLAAGAAAITGCTSASAPSGASSTPVGSAGASATTAAATASASASATASPTPTAPNTPLPPPPPLPQQNVTPWGKPDFSRGTAIGDGSQAPTGKAQQFQRPITKLKPGETPPQFVVFSWDGASGNNDYIMDFVHAAHNVQGTMTLFSSGLYFLPAAQKLQYHPPKNPPGASDIPYMSDKTVKRTIEDTGDAWCYGNEVGTHFNGHFSDPKVGVYGWSQADWEQEFSEAVKLVTHWRTYSGFTDVTPLPFDYTKECVGARTPLLGGWENWRPVAAKHGFRYDTSATRAGIHWPKKDSNGLWDMSMFEIPFRNHSIIPMDYNFYFEQAKGDDNVGTDADRAVWKAEHADTLRRGLQLCLNGNRAPFIIGNHLSRWQNGIYQDNLLALITEFGKVPGVQLVSHRWLCDWLDAQDPAVLADLQSK